MAVELKLRQGAWYLDREWILEFPQDWKVEVFSPAAMENQDREQILNSIRHPVGSDPLQSYLKPGSRVLIICDDFSRPTRTDILLPILLEHLGELGVQKGNISILIATGTHRPMAEKEVELKLGKTVCREYSIHQHSHRRRGKYAGTTRSGTPVYVNKLMPRSDLIIGMGGIYPHNVAGFSGGAKLILGVSSIKTILHFHHLRTGASTGGPTGNELRYDLLEAARLAGLHFIINSTIDPDRNITRVVAGDVEKAFHEGVMWCREHYGVPPPDPERFNLVIADTYPFDASYAFTRKGWWPVRGDEPFRHKLILSAMVEGKGSHLVYPIPFDRRINKWKRLWFELISFGFRHFISSTLVIRFQSIMKRSGSGNRFPGRAGNRSSVATGENTGGEAGGETGFPGQDVDILHCAKGDAADSLMQLPNRIYDRPSAYFRAMGEQYGRQPVRVAFYRCSALTFPQKQPTDKQNVNEGSISQ